SIELIEEECGEIGWLEFGSSDQMRRGDEVFTLGFPLGQESLKGTQGVISGYQNVFLQQQGFNRFCLQTTAPINNGNSGGPALNKAGQVVGINFAAFAEAQNVGYIIPIDGVKSDLDNMFCSKLVRAQPMGMAVQPMTPSMAKALKCPKRLTGVYVVSVFDRGFTGLLGIKSGDVISEVNGLKVDFQGQVSVDWSDERVDADEVTARVPFGKEIACKVCRDGKIITLKSEKTLGSLLPIRTWFPPYESFDYEVFGGGLVVAPLSLNLVLILCDRKPTLRSYLLNQNQVDGKLVISHVLPTSAASDPRNLFRLGSVIKFVNDKEVTTLQEFRDVIKSALKNEEFITFTTDNGFKEVFESKSVLKDSLRLSKMFLFTKENSISLNMAEQN
ncbi:trypsin-like peptidase domain-containing protein, partial [Candidatus Babeliales bacterium]|nr:trypsin-like peptidase domain-containing protein [Candidatus Babeliales bacterium]